MTLRKVTTDNTVRFVKKSEQTGENKPIMIKNETKSEELQPISGGGKPNTRKQNKNIPQINKNFPEKISTMGFKFLK